MSELRLLTPDWPAPERVKACFSSRQGGCSQAPYSSFNLALHVGDDPAHVNANRSLLAAALGQKTASFTWLDQVHGTKLLEAGNIQESLQADGVYTERMSSVCVVMTADCLPVLFCDRQGKKVMAVHAGWRGLASGIIEKAVQEFGRADQVFAWMGPAIGPNHFEVGEEVRDAFLSLNAMYASAFVPSGRHDYSGAAKYFADIYKLCQSQLALSGVSSDLVFGGDFCTYSDEERFFSYRRDGAASGRMATMVWLEPS